jgi:hypothetical protein
MLAGCRPGWLVEGLAGWLNPWLNDCNLEWLVGTIACWLTKTIAGLPT